MEMDFLPFCSASVRSAFSMAYTLPVVVFLPTVWIWSAEKGRKRAWAPAPAQLNSSAQKAAAPQTRCNHPDENRGLPLSIPCLLLAASRTAVKLAKTGWTVHG